MRHSSLVIYLLLVTTILANGQNYVYRGSQTNEINNTDSLHKAPTLDSTLLGVNIFNLLHQNNNTSGEITINQSSKIAAGMTSYLEYNKTKKIPGYRVRIFFDNKRTARNQSEEFATAFAEEYPEIGVYRQYENPYFKVTVGDFRTKSEAQKFLNSIKNKYPSVFIVRENINYPL